MNEEKIYTYLRGVLPLLTGAFIQSVILITAQDYAKYKESSWNSYLQLGFKSAAFFASTLVSHPFYVLAARV